MQLDNFHDELQQAEQDALAETIDTCVSQLSAETISTP